jgi:hypothetical protein
VVSGDGLLLAWPPLDYLAVRDLEPRSVAHVHDLWPGGAQVSAVFWYVLLSYIWGTLVGATLMFLTLWRRK